MLRQRGIAADHVGELGLAKAPDEHLLEYARRGGYCVVTLDSDFHASLAASGSCEPSVIRIRIQKLRAPELVALIEMALDRCGEELSAGAAVSITAQRLRVRLLPIGR